jgi:hypothetical protein
MMVMMVLMMMMWFFMMMMLWALLQLEMHLLSLHLVVSG